MTLSDHIRLIWARPHVSGPTIEDFIFDDGLPPPTQEDLAATYDAARAAWEAERNAPQPKTWPSVEEFTEEFTLEECSAIELSTDPQIAALRFKLKTWRSAVHSNHPLVAAGFAALLASGIISEARKNEILSVQ